MSQDTIIANNRLVTPSGLNLLSSSARTRVPSQGALAYEEGTQLLYYGTDTVWTALSTSSGFPPFTFYAYNQVGVSGPTSTILPISYTNQFGNTNPAFDGTTFTVPVDGTYNLDYAVVIGGTGTNQWQTAMDVYRASVLILSAGYDEFFATIQPPASSILLQGSANLQLLAGDQVQVEVLTNLAPSAYIPGERPTYFTVSRVS